MIHEIKVYDANGVLKKTYDSKKATDMFWDSNEPITLNKRFCTKGAGKVREGTTMWGKKGVEYENKKCPQCKKEFLAKGKMKFCTTVCQRQHWRNVTRSKWQKGTLAKFKNSRLVDGNILFRIKCEHCDVVADMTACTARFCSTDCREKAHKISYREVKKKRDAERSKKKREISKAKRQADRLLKPIQTG